MTSYDVVCLKLNSITHPWKFELQADENDTQNPNRMVV
jgi:hypothetical protein